MQVKKMGEHFLARLETGEEVIASLRALAVDHEVGFAALQGIGALRRATLGYFDSSTRTYCHLPVEEQVEVVSLGGNVSRGEDGDPAVHAHAVLGRANGETLGGHLVEGEVSPTLEVILRPLPGTAIRRKDPATGLALWDLS